MNRTDKTYEIFVKPLKQEPFTSKLESKSEKSLKKRTDSSSYRGDHHDRCPFCRVPAYDDDGLCEEKTIKNITKKETNQLGDCKTR